MVADLIAAEPAARERATGADARQRVEAFAEQLVGAMQGLANWWADHEEVDRAWIVARGMEFAWLGLRGVATGESDD